MIGFDDCLLFCFLASQNPGNHEAEANRTKHQPEYQERQA